jgi:hypothetical protein
MLNRPNNLPIATRNTPAHPSRSAAGRPNLVSIQRACRFQGIEREITIHPSQHPPKRSDEGGRIATVEEGVKPERLRQLPPQAATRFLSSPEASRFAGAESLQPERQRKLLWSFPRTPRSGGSSPQAATQSPPSRRPTQRKTGVPAALERKTGSRPRAREPGRHEHGNRNNSSMNSAGLGGHKISAEDSATTENQGGASFAPKRKSSTKVISL